MKVVVTIPAYNEEKTIAKVLDEITQVMTKTPYEFSILVMNDGSRDRTAEIARRYGAKVVSHKRNKGLAEGFKTEMKACLQLNADVIVHTDADGQYPAEFIPQMVKKIESGYDLVLGSRFGKGRYSGSFMKSFGNIAFAYVFSGLLKQKISDTTTGFRAFTKEVAELPLINSFTYTQEQLIRAGKAKMKVGEVPITTRKTRPSRLFSNPFSYAIKAWFNILRIYRDFAPLKFFGTIGAFFFGIGFLLGVLVLWNIIQFGSAGGLPRVILSALCILTGIQIWLFGFLADSLKK